MSKIAGVLHVERRTDERYGVELRVQYAWEGKILDGVTLDISNRGMRLQTEVDLGRENRLVTYFRLPHESEMHQVEAEVMWVAMSERILGLYECGLRFVSGKTPALQALHRLITQLAGVDPDELPLASEDDVMEVSEPRSSHLLADLAARAPDSLSAWPSQPDAGFSPHALNEALAADHQRRKSDGDAAQAKLSEARRLLQSGDAATAQSRLEEAAQLMPDSADILEALGEAMYRQGNVAGAASVFDRALRLRQE